MAVQAAEVMVILVLRATCMGPAMVLLTVNFNVLTQQLLIHGLVMDFAMMVVLVCI